MPNATGDTFAELLRTQIRHEFTAAQQYLAAAVHLDALRLPRLAAICYGNADDKRTHALRMVRYLLDRDLPVTIGEIGAIRSEFDTASSTIAFLGGYERNLTDQITALARAARASGDFLGEQFVRWFLKDQVDEVARMSTLLTVCERATDLFEVEEFVAREVRPLTADATAPRPAGR
ncbi:ferritin [Nocardia stercoris]|uniref:Ferritin n=1 Tax=Nocardia stercoris TaxID=2483361 RepID=A0A3M2L9T4_9NOCA|nr:ferritin-like domain-containing protein [Nocardia stercoris]RMI34174.1 ferritin [Nocardia stercoris]